MNPPRRPLSHEQAEASKLCEQLCFFVDWVEAEEREKLERLANDLKIEKIEIE